MNETQIDQLRCLVEKSPSQSSCAIIIAHGYGASMQDLAGLSQYLKLNQNVDWYFPNAPVEIPMGPFYSGWAWYPLEIDRFQNAILNNQLDEIQNHKPEGIEEARDLLFGFYNQVSKEYDKIILGGFSQGSILSLDLCFNQSLSPKALLLLSSCIVDKSHWVKPTTNFSPTDFFQSHGRKDEVLPFSIAKDLNNLLINKGHKGDLLAFDGGHEIPQNTLLALQKFLNKKLL